MPNAVDSYQYHQDGTLPINGEILTFGSNDAGVHMAGAARAALQFGAIMGKSVGLVGNTYAIPTKDCRIQSHTLSRIKSNIDDFIKFATDNRDKTFFVTRVACVLAGYTDAQIAPMFRGAPPNCNFAEQWRPYLEHDADFTF